MNTEKQIWLVTGASQGLGLYLTKHLLSLGHQVIAASRNAEAVETEISHHRNNLFAVKLDITSNEQVKQVVDQYVDKLGRIDVVVNNAGYCLVGSIEESTDAEFRATIDVNLFGTINVIRNVMPYMRKRKSGHIINISSVAGYSGFANAASYNAAKFAVIGLTEGFAKEAEPFGIKATVIAPGQFRTNFMDSLHYADDKIDLYGTAESKKAWQSFSGKQAGDPAKLAAIIAKVGTMDNPPLHLLAGTDAYDDVVAKREAELEEIKKWKSLTLSTDFD